MGTGLAARLTAALERSASRADFRTADSLAEELGADVDDVRWAAQRLIDEGRVRRPYAGGARYLDWYAPASKPMTWREKLLRLMAMAGREPL